MNLKKIYHDIFEIGLTVKFIEGILDLIVGILFLFNSRIIIDFVYKIFGTELIEDPNDFLANLFINGTQNITSNFHILASMYLIIHGLIKIMIIIALWKKKLWAYPLTAAILSALVIYQIYRIITIHLIFLAVLTIIDIIIILLLRSEYKRIKKKQKKLKSSYEA